MFSNLIQHCNIIRYPIIFCLSAIQYEAMFRFIACFLAGERAPPTVCTILMLAPGHQWKQSCHGYTSSHQPINESNYLAQTTFF